MSTYMPKTKQTLITCFLLLLLTLSITNVAAAKPTPTPSPSPSPTPTPKIPLLGSATVDGKTTEWHTAAGSSDFFDYLYNGYDHNGKHQIAGMAYIRYEPSTMTVYVLVLASNGYVGLAGSSVNWIAISQTFGEIKNKVVTAGSDNNGVAPDFAYVGYNKASGTIEGFEASFKLAPATYYIALHLQVQDASGHGSATAGTYLKTVPVTFELPDIALAPTLVAALTGFAAFGVFKLIKRKQ
jgi:hypothetical protein